jgi:hypothetical protein
MATTGDSCLLMDQDGMSNLYRGPSIDASYQVSDYLAKRFHRRFLEIDQSEIRIASPNVPKLCRMHLWEVLYNDNSFCPDPLTNMATTGNSCF